jgi:glutathione synthase
MSRNPDRNGARDDHGAALPAGDQDGDKRILIIDGESCPSAWRAFRQGETRGNLAAGGTGVARPLTERDREIAETLGRR